jgi:hypothetical protein
MGRTVAFCRATCSPRVLKRGFLHTDICGMSKRTIDVHPTGAPAAVDAAQLAITHSPAPEAPPLPTVLGSNNVVVVGWPTSFAEAVARTLGKEPDTLIRVPNGSVAEGLLVAAGDRIDVMVLSPEVMPTDAFDLAEFIRERSLGTSIVLARYAPVWARLVELASQSDIREVVGLEDASEATPELRAAILRAAMSVRASRVRARMNDPRY